MESRIACSAPGCMEAVTGQCPGYKKNCGRFYCAKHSEDGLCHVCSVKKACDEEAARRYKEYQAEAERIGHLSKFAYSVWMSISVTWIVISVVMFLLISGGIAPPRIEDVIAVAACFLLSLGLVFYLPAKLRSITHEVREVDKLKPGFAEFHTKWTINRYVDSEVLIETISEVLFVTAAAGSAETGESKNEAIRGNKKDETAVH